MYDKNNTNPIPTIYDEQQFLEAIDSGNIGQISPHAQYKRETPWKNDEEYNTLDLYFTKVIYHKDNLNFIKDKYCNFALATKTHDEEYFEKYFTGIQNSAIELACPAFLGKIKNGNTVTFTNSTTRRQFLADGWASSESWGTWSEGKISNIRFTVHGNASIINIDVHTIFVTPQHPQQYVEISVNGIITNKITYTTPESHKITIPLTKDILKNIKNDGYVSITFKLPNAIAPKDINLSADTRKLALGIKSLTVQ